MPRLHAKPCRFALAGFFPGSDVKDVLAANPDSETDFMHAIVGIPAFSDNYIWLLDNGDGSAMVVDPGDAAPVELALAERKLQLSAILITHHHFDHVGGVQALKDAHSCTVYAPANPAIPAVDAVLQDGDRVDVGAYSFHIFAVPGHTLDHIAYFQESNQPGFDQPLLFCGDTLFAGGCGRIFEGDPPMMHASLSKLAQLPDNTAVYCAHEYTLANLAFARAADPQNSDLRQREVEARSLRERELPTVPSTIGLERATNPFLRAHLDALRAGLANAGSDSGIEAGNNPVSTFARLRAWKDNF
jgi:hydroxyacylglutathione hydrolase